MPNLTGRVVKSDWQLVHFTVYSEKFAIYSECYCLNSQHGSMSLCGLFCITVRLLKIFWTTLHKHIGQTSVYERTLYWKGDMLSDVSRELQTGLEFSFPLLLFPFTDFYGRFDSLSPILRDSSCLLWAFSFKFCAVNRRAAGYNWSTRAWPTFDRCVHCIQKISWILLNFFFKNSFSKDNRCMWGQE